MPLDGVAGAKTSQPLFPYPQRPNEGSVATVESPRMIAFWPLAAVAFAFSRSVNTALSALAKGVDVRFVGATNSAASELSYVISSGCDGKVFNGVDCVAAR